MRKQLIPGGLLFLLSLLLCRCNSDVFVGEQLKASVTELELDGNGDTQTVTFNSSDWDIVDVYPYSASSGLSLYWRIFDQEGNLIEENYGDAHLKGFGRIEYYKSDWDDTKICHLERNKGKELTIVVEENIDLYTWEFQINLDNDDDFYHPEIINLRIPPCDRYEVVGFTFPDTPSSYHKRAYTSNYTAKIDNSHSDTPLTTTLYPFAGASREFTFYTTPWSLPSDLMKDDQLTIELPMYQDGKLIPSGIFAPYHNGGTIEFPLENLEEETVEVTVPARTKQEIEVWLYLETFDTSYTLAIRNPKSGKIRTYTGEMDCDIPYDYFLEYKTPEE